MAHTLSSIKILCDTVYELPPSVSRSVVSSVSGSAKRKKRNSQKVDLEIHPLRSIPLFRNGSWGGNVLLPSNSLEAWKEMLTQRVSPNIVKKG